MLEQLFNDSTLHLDPRRGFPSALLQNISPLATICPRAALSIIFVHTQTQRVIHHLLSASDMNFLDLANLLDNDGNMQNEMMVMAFAATLLSTIPVLLGNEFDVNVGLRRKKRFTIPSSFEELEEKWQQVKFHLQTLPKIIKKLERRDPAFLRSLEQ